MRYYRMNGCGNAFVIFDARPHGALNLSPAQARAIADPAGGAGGCDQVIAIEASVRGEAFMRIWNADGGEVGACGNAARCVGWLLLEEGLGRDGEVRLETAAGLLAARTAGEARVAVDMGSPLLKWEEIPVARRTDTVEMAYEYQAPDGTVFAGPGGVNMGNPHAVFFVEDAAAVDVAGVGAAIEVDPFFPQRVNVGFAQVMAPDHIRLRVWERGAGLTRACGTGACAALVACARAGLTLRQARLELDGGDLDILWRPSDDRVIMTGPVALEQSGDLFA